MCALAGRVPGQRLREGHDRVQVTLRMQQIMMERMQGSV